MDFLLENYLAVVDRQLKSMPPLERIDVRYIIESRVEEMCFFEGADVKEALELLGDPVDVAHDYLGACIGNTKGISLQKLRMLFAFYKTSGHGSLIVLPCLSVLSVALIASGAVTAIGGLIRAGSVLLSQGRPYPMIQFGVFELPPLSVVPVALIGGALLVIGGIGIWQLMMRYVRTGGSGKEKGTPS